MRHPWTSTFSTSIQSVSAGEGCTLKALLVSHLSWAKNRKSRAVVNIFWWLCSDRESQKLYSPLLQTFHTISYIYFVDCAETDQTHRLYVFLYYSPQHWHCSPTALPLLSLLFNAFLCLSSLWLWLYSLASILNSRTE